MVDVHSSTSAREEPAPLMLEGEECTLSYVLGFCSSCSLVKLYWQKECKVKAALFILLLS